MDKNTIVGILLIFVILIGFSYLNKPSQEEIEAARRRQDSIAQVEAQRKQEAEAAMLQQTIEQQQNIEPSDSTAISKDIVDRYGPFAQAVTGDEEFITLENNLMKIRVSTKGGRVYSVELKNFLTYKGAPLILFDGPDNVFGLNFFAQNRSINTDDLYFIPSTTEEILKVDGPQVRKGREGNENFNREHPGGEQVLKMKLPAGDDKAYLEYEYTLRHNSYMVGFQVNVTGMDKMISSSQNYLNLSWTVEGPRFERRSQIGEDRNTSVNYKYYDDDVDKLTPGKSSQETLKTKVKWISFKHLFFNSTIIAENGFPTADIKYEHREDSENFVGNFFADIALPYENKQSQSYDMDFYFGPNHFQTLRQYDLQLDELINLGYSILRPVNRFLIIPVFNLLKNQIANFGIIILLLTLFIKLILFPFTYKSHISQAKMKALKPEMDEINAKFPKEKAMEKQQAIMALYKKAGVSPMGGCLPMLLQMPILLAMFFFFPNSIELRQESFLWANDLSSYDSILTLPFNIPFYGSHVSLFCLLMTITTILTTKLNPATTSGQSMPGMKTMMYMMPVMFLFILNSYPAGLSYYYFLANVITIGQMFLFSRLIDEDKIRARIHSNKKKPVQKSNFQKRLEKMAKEKGVQLPK